jgi:hypothetical protein
MRWDLPGREDGTAAVRPADSPLTARERRALTAHWAAMEMQHAAPGAAWPVCQAIGRRVAFTRWLVREGRLSEWPGEEHHG